MDWCLDDAVLGVGFKKHCCSENRQRSASHKARQSVDHGFSLFICALLEGEIWCRWGSSPSVKLNIGDP